VVDVGMSKPRPGECPGHGSFRYEKVLERGGPMRPVSQKRQAEEEAGTRKKSRGSTLKPSNGFAASPAQRAKVKGLPCLACRQEAKCDPAHVWRQAMGGCDHVDCVVPLCRSCHRAFDQGELDLLPILAGSESWAKEQAHPIAEHGVGLVELVKRLGGNQTEVVEAKPEAVSA
jgi:hypothetical protein